jgi:hypothetical protein
LAPLMQVSNISGAKNQCAGVLTSRGQSLPTERTKAVNLLSSLGRQLVPTGR